MTVVLDVFSSFRYHKHMEYKASHILVKDRALAESLLKKIKSGADFAALARDYSTCPSKSKGGDLGWFGPGKMVKEFEDAVRRLSNGSVSPVIRTQFGFHIVKRTGYKD